MHVLGGLLVRHRILPPIAVMVTAPTAHRTMDIAMVAGTTVMDIREAVSVVAPAVTPDGLIGTDCLGGLSSKKLIFSFALRRLLLLMYRNRFYRQETTDHLNR